MKTTVILQSPWATVNPKRVHTTRRVGGTEWGVLARRTLTDGGHRHQHGNHRLICPGPSFSSLGVRPPSPWDCLPLPTRGESPLSSPLPTSLPQRPEDPIRKAGPGGTRQILETPSRGRPKPTGPRAPTLGRSADVRRRSQVTGPVLSSPSRVSARGPPDSG